MTKKTQSKMQVALLLLFAAAFPFSVFFQFWAGCWLSAVVTVVLAVRYLPANGTPRSNRSDAAGLSHALFVWSMFGRVVGARFRQLRGGPSMSGLSAGTGDGGGDADDNI